MTVLLSIAVAIILALLTTRIAKRLGLPAVTAYLITGVLIGPYCLGRLGIEGVGFTSMEMVEKLTLLAQTALGFIAFAIGNEFRMESLKKNGRQVTVIGIAQALITTLVVDAVLIALHFILGPDVLSLPAAITLGAIAAATAPAATLMVIRQYKAKGQLTSLLLSVIALDDAVGLVVFAISFGIARSIGNGAVDMISILVEPIIEIVGSLLLGALMGYVLTKLEKLFNSNSNRLTLSTSFVLLTVALAMCEFHIGPVTVGFSSLLVCMMMGTVFCNICPLSEDLMQKTDKWTAPLFVLFFVVSGAELELSVFTSIAVIGIGVAYILSRSFGKYIGAYISCRLAKCDEKVTKYLGITLLPQAGVALGMCVTASALGADGVLVRNIILFAVLIYELIGPAMTKHALIKAGEISEKGDEVLNRREQKLKAVQQK